MGWSNTTPWNRKDCLDIQLAINRDSGTLEISKMKTRKLELQYLVRLDISTVTSMKMAAFWDDTLHSLVDIDRRFRGTYFLYHLDYGVSKILWNVTHFLSDYTVQHTRRQPYSTRMRQCIYVRTHVCLPARRDLRWRETNGHLMCTYVITVHVLCWMSWHLKLIVRSTVLNL
jgi:hypothetical protein